MSEWTPISSARTIKRRRLMFLIDTNVISEVRKGRRADAGVQDFWAAVALDNTPLFLAAITIGELRRGVELICHRGDQPQAKLLELVHRLDRDTSGILLVAKKRSALRHLQDQFRERETGKTYLALVKGDWPAKLKVIDQPLLKFLLQGQEGAEGERRVRVTTPEDPDGMRSITLVNVSRRLPGATLLEVTIKTGRTHQIRVHLASQGHPIAGDDKYGDFEWNRQLQKPGRNPGLKRMFLHAWRLQFNHPVTAERVSLQTDLPPELKAYVDHASPSE